MTTTDPAVREVLAATRLAVGVDTLAALIQRHAGEHGLTFEQATDGRIDWPSAAPFGPRGEVDEHDVRRALAAARSAR